MEAANSSLDDDSTHICAICKTSFPSSEAPDLHYSCFYHHPSEIATSSAVKTGQEDEVNENEDDGKEIWLQDRYAICFRLYAEAALEYYNNQNVGKRYALVENGPAVAFELMVHSNFKAKEEDCPSAPVETFFAQFSTWPHTIVHCCISLGPSNKLPHWRKAELGGCQFCHGVINHPTEWVANLRLKLEDL